MYLKAKQIVSTKYDSDDSFYPLFVLAIYAFLQKYPTLSSEILTIFLNTDIYIENDSISNIIQKHRLSSLKLNEDECEIDPLLGTSSYQIRFYKEGDEVHISKGNPVVICSLKNVSTTLVFNIFIHEMNHLMKGYENGFEEYEDEEVIGYYARSGVNYYHCEYSKKDKLFHIMDYCSMFEEVINSLQTQEMLASVLDLDGIIPDKDIQDYFNSFQKDELLDNSIYTTCVDIMRPMWENPVFHTLVEDNIYVGNIATIIQGVDEVLGKNAFADIAKSLDELESVSVSEEKKKELIRFLQEQVHLYNSKTYDSYQK